MTPDQKREFKSDTKKLWLHVRSVINPKYHSKFRRVMLNIIRKEEAEYREFVALMTTTPEDTANTKLQEAAHAATDYDSAVERQLIEDGVATHGCHYCGNLFHLSKLAAAEMGLICDNCRKNEKTAN